MASWQPVQGTMLTPWAVDVSPGNAWAEYPRPQLVRDDWSNLNGLWDFAVTAKEAVTVDEWTEQILIPFCPESALSGVGRLIEPTEALWYRRALPGPTEDRRTLLHFEAVDYLTSVWVNGHEVGAHQGGNTAFWFDITDALQAGDNELRVRVYDATGGYQLHGKQKLENRAIFYTRVSGIWQTVWLEQVPETHIRDLQLNCDIETGSIRVDVDLAGTRAGASRVRVTAAIDGADLASVEGTGPIELTIPDPRLWSPAEPVLYNLTIELMDEAGGTIDLVRSYTALRAFGKQRDADGNWRFTLNGETLFHWGPLDQGWWPDGLLTPPSDTAMRSDIEFLKAAGFNMIRKHIKVEPRRYYAHCDRIGMLVWQDQVSSGYGGGKDYPKSSSAPWTRMAPNPVDARWPDNAHAQWRIEFERMVEQLRNHPCIAVWVPFNEAWGQHATMEVGAMAVALDPSRSINIASGGNFWPVGDVADHHNYPDPEFPLEDPRFNEFIKVVGEFGGHGWPVRGHLWDRENDNWGYGGLPENLDEWKQRYARSIDILCALRKQGIAAGVYTQTTDVEVEINGLLTYDRAPKVDAEFLRALTERLFASEP